MCFHLIYIYLISRHYPSDDAKGNAEALVAMQEMGLHIKF